MSQRHRSRITQKVLTINTFHWLELITVLLGFLKILHSVKSVHSRSYSGPDCPAFRQNTERYEVFLRIQSKYRKMRTRITPNTTTFNAVFSLKRQSYSLFDIFENLWECQIAKLAFEKDWVLPLRSMEV